MKIETVFVRIGPVSGQKQKHKGQKEAPCSRGIWALPQIISSDLYYLGIDNWISKKYDDNEKEFIIKTHLRKHIKLKYTDKIYHHLNTDMWVECSVREYFKIAIKYMNIFLSWKHSTGTKDCLDGEFFEVFIKMWKGIKIYV